MDADIMTAFLELGKIIDSLMGTEFEETGKRLDEVTKNLIQTLMNYK